MPPRVIVLDCDWGADWPTWTPAAHEAPETGRLDYLPFDEVELTEPLRNRLREWQRWWEALDPVEEDRAIPEAEWSRFMAEGRKLVTDLQHELGDAAQVRLGFGDPWPPIEP